MSLKIKANRIKPKYNGKNKKKTTDEDKEYLEWLQHQDYKCFVCGKQNGIEFHHIKEYSTDKKNHQRLIPLCFMHHRLSNDISAHGTPKKWRETYTMEQQNEVADKIYQDYKTKALNEL